MNNKRFLSIFCIIIILSTSLIITPSIKADDPTIDQQQTNHPYELHIGDPGTINTVDQGFKPDKTKITKIEIYVDSFGSGTVTAGIGYKTNTFPYWVWLGNQEKTNLNTGWNTFNFNEATVTPGDQYYIKITYQGSSHIKIGWDNSNPYNKGNMWDNDNGERPDDDIAFKIWGYNPNQLPNAPNLDYPTNGATYNVEQGQNKDITLKATATDPDDNQIKYTFYNDDNNNIIGTTNWKNSGEQGTTIWENLNPGTYNWYAKAKDNEGYGSKSSTVSFTINENTDDEPPTPNPSEWDQVPTEIGTDSIEMKAKSASDPHGVEYFFEETSGNIGGSNSGWQSSRSYIDEDLESNTEYTYRVVTRDNLGNTGGWSVSKSATTENDGPDNHPPYAPSDPTPVPSATQIPLGTVLTWSGGDPDGDDVTYDVYLSVCPEPDELEPYLESLTECQCVLPNLNIELKYYWRVVATDEHGAVREGPIWTFSTKTLENSNPTDNNQPNKPSKPVLVFPNAMHVNVGDLCFFTVDVSDPDEDNLNVYWDFDNDDSIDFQVLNYSGTGCGALFVWDKPAGYHNVRVITSDLYHETSEWSDSLFVNVLPAEDNNPPNNVSAPGGISRGYEKQEYTFSIYTIDPDNDKVKYRWDWGDGTYTDWEDVSWQDSGSTASYSHIWNNKGTYYVRVKVKDLNGAETPWSETKKVTIVEKNTAIIYNKDDFTGATYGDIFENFLGQGRIVHANGNTGAIVTGSFGGCPIGDAWSVACQGVDFYLGRRKQVTIDAEIDFISGTEYVTPGSFAWIYKVLRIDNFYDPDIEHKIWMNNIFDLGLQGLKDVGSVILKLFGPSIAQTSTTTLDLYHVLKVADYLHRFSYSDEIASAIVQQTSFSRMLPDAANTYASLWDKVAVNGGFMHTESSWTTTLKSTTHTKIPAAGIWLALTAAFEIWTLFQLMTHWNIDGLLNEYEKNGQANTQHVSKTVTLDKGNHDVWAGLETKAFGMAICFGFGYGAGQVNSITIEGIAPPDTPVLSYPDTMYAGDSINFRPYCVDQNDDPVKFIIDWGDGTETTTGFYDSEEEGLETHTYSSAGSYIVTIIAEDCDRMQSESKSYEIIVAGDNDPPVVSITQPDNYFYNNGRKFFRFVKPIVFGEITIKADAFDSSGISYVQFFVDGRLEETDNTYPYSISYNDRGFGDKNIEVIAMDKSGKKSIDSKSMFYFNLI